MNRYQKEYIHRINRVIDFIEANLDKDLSLEMVAEVANFSPFHFHRIFSAFVGETLLGFIKRKRVERAASLLIDNPESPITDIAFYCGYSSSSVFCRAFKERFGTSAQQFRTAWAKNSKNRQLLSNSSKLTFLSNAYVCDINSLTIWRKEMKNVVEILDLPAMNVIYCRHKGAFDQIGAAYDKLFKWAGARGLLDNPNCKGITYYHDDPKVTEVENIRQSACVTVFEDVKTEGEIGKMAIPGGKYAVGHFEVSASEFQQAWDSMCLWVAESGFQPADASPYELYHNHHEEHPEKKFIVDICIPVKAL